MAGMAGVQVWWLSSDVPRGVFCENRRAEATIDKDMTKSVGLPAPSLALALGVPQCYPGRGEREREVSYLGSEGVGAQAQVLQRGEAGEGGVRERGGGETQ